MPYYTMFLESLKEDNEEEGGTVVFVSDERRSGNDDDYFPYLNTSNNSEEAIQFRKNSWSNMERCIPVEYSSSPIAEILANSVLKEVDFYKYYVKFNNDCIFYNIFVHLIN